MAAGPCSITASQSGNASYSPAPNIIQGFTVSKATLTVTAQNATTTYPAASPAFSANITGFVNSDLSTVVAGSPAFLNSAATTNGKPNAGTWIITPSAGSLAASNYTFSYVNGTLTVNGSPLTVTAANASKAYGTTFGATAFTTSGLLSGDSVSSVTLSSSGASGAAPVAGSPYSIVPSAAVGTGLANYAISYVNGTLTVNRAALTVTANDASRAFGAVNPPLSAVIAGFVNGETSAVVTGAPALSTTAAPRSSGGAYPITPAVGALSAANYTFGFVNGTLTISKVRTSISLTAAPAASVYGQPVVLTATVGPATTPPGLALPIGQVSFSAGGPATLALGTTSVTVTTLSVGTHSITAQYNGDTTWPSASGEISVTVSPAFTATALSLKIVSGQLALVAAITPVAPGAGIATGIVQFVNTSNNTIVASAGLSGGNAIANVSTSAIGLPIVAVYGGDANFKGSTSATLPALVNAATNLSTIFARDEVVSLFNVTGLSGDTSGPLPLTTSLGGVTVTATDSAGVARQAQLYGVFGSAGQINFVIPSATGPGPATVTITLPSSATVTTVIQVAVAAPGIFTANMNGQGPTRAKWLT